MSSTLRRTAFLVFLAFTISFFPLQAQSDSPAAHLSGALLDSTGAGVPGVRITAQLEKRAQRNSLGRSLRKRRLLFARSLPAGRYRIQFTRESFVPRDFVPGFFSRPIPRVGSAPGTGATFFEAW